MKLTDEILFYLIIIFLIIVYCIIIFNKERNKIKNNITNTIYSDNLETKFRIIISSFFKNLFINNMNKKKQKEYIIDIMKYDEELNLYNTKQISILKIIKLWKIKLLRRLMN